MFFHIHPTHFLNSRAHGIGVGRSQSPTRERDSIFGFSTGSRRLSEFSASDQGPHPWENNLYFSEPSTDGALEDLLEHAQDVSLWVAVEICSASSIKVNNCFFVFFQKLAPGVQEEKLIILLHPAKLFKLKKASCNSGYQLSVVSNSRCLWSIVLFTFDVIGQSDDFTTHWLR